MERWQEIRKEIQQSNLSRVEGLISYDVTGIQLSIACKKIEVLENSLELVKELIKLLVEEEKIYQEKNVEFEEMLKELEWIYRDPKTSNRECPICGAKQHLLKGHLEDCRLDKLINKAQES